MSSSVKSSVAQRFSPAVNGLSIPIDGTKNFVRGVPVWATLIALLDDGVPVVGVVSAPALQPPMVGRPRGRRVRVVRRSEPAHLGVTGRAHRLGEPDVFRPDHRLGRPAPDDSSN